MLFHTLFAILDLKISNITSISIVSIITVRPKFLKKVDKFFLRRRMLRIENLEVEKSRVVTSYRVEVCALTFLKVRRLEYTHFFSERGQKNQYSIFGTRFTPKFHPLKLKFSNLQYERFSALTL